MRRSNDAPLRRLTALTGAAPLAEGAAVWLPGTWKDDDLTNVIAAATGCQPRRTPGIATDHSMLLSDSRSRLALHQEDYHLSERPRLLVLRCDKNTVQSGDTVISRVRPDDISGDPALSQVRLRFFRKRAQAWTPWRPLVEVRDGTCWTRIALPDVHRNVEASAHSQRVFALFARLTANAERCGWTPGAALVIDNRLALHGRLPMSDGSRWLSRWVV